MLCLPIDVGHSNPYLILAACLGAFWLLFVLLVVFRLVDGVYGCRFPLWWRDCCLCASRRYFAYRTQWVGESGVCVNGVCER